MTKSPPRKCRFYVIVDHSNSEPLHLRLTTDSCLLPLTAYLLACSVCPVVWIPVTCDGQCGHNGSIRSFFNVCFCKSSWVLRKLWESTWSRVCQLYQQQSKQSHDWGGRHWHMTLERSHHRRLPQNLHCRGHLKRPRPQQIPDSKPLHSPRRARLWAPTPDLRPESAKETLYPWT